jgi:HK97 family phage major capsid protein
VKPRKEDTVKNLRTINIGALALYTIAAAAAVVAGTDFVMHVLGIDWRDATHGGLTLMEGAAAVTIGEQIKSFKAKRDEILGKLKDLVDLSLKEGRSLDATERENHSGWKAELAVADEHIKMLEDHEQLLLAEGKGIDQNAGREDEGQRDTRGAKGANNGVLLPGGARQIQVRKNLPKGIGFTRFSLAMAQAKGEIMFALEIAKNQYADTPEVANCLRAAIAMGGTKNLTLHAKAAVTPVAGTDTAVTQYNDLENEFIDLLRPKMIVGRMEQLDRVPFLSRLGRQLTGVSGSFVGEGAPKPVQKQTYDSVTLGYAKVAVIVVLTDEGARFSTIQAEMRARDDMVKGIATYIDKRFIDPSYSGVANVSPASITNGARRIQSTGATLAAMDIDVANAQAEFSGSDVDPSTAVWVMPASVALKLSMKRNAYDEFAFPGMANAIATGRGTWYGLPVLVSNAMVAAGSPAEKQIALVTQDEVLIAEDTGISIDMSREASVQMNDAPSAGAQSLVSLWQNNLLGIRAEQYINWAPKRPNNLGIVLIENTNY